MNLKSIERFYYNYNKINSKYNNFNILSYNIFDK